MCALRLVYHIKKDMHGKGEQHTRHAKSGLETIDTPTSSERLGVEMHESQSSKSLTAVNLMFT